MGCMRVTLQCSKQAYIVAIKLLIFIDRCFHALIMHQN
jgi:hypothetical protein